MTTSMTDQLRREAARVRTSYRETYCKIDDAFTIHSTDVKF